MTVGELREMLEAYEDDAEVVIVTQQSWPFENNLYGVTSRAEVLDDPRYDDGEEYHDPDAVIEDDLGDGKRRSDVFIVEGSQLRYGMKAAWECR